MAEISILLPTRRRVNAVYRLLASIEETADDPRALEIVISTDEDDPQSQAIVYPGLTVVMLVQPPMTMGEITNACYRASTGQCIVLMNDDVVFRTHGWDRQVLRACSQYPDGIALIYGNDLHKGRAMPSFPILPREVCDAMDGICPPGYIRFHIEYHLLDVFRRLKALRHDRIVYLEDVIFEHMHYSIGKSEPDETYLGRNNIDDEVLFVVLARERRDMAMRLEQYIRNAQGGSGQGQ